MRSLRSPRLRAGEVHNPKRKSYRRNDGEDKGHLWALGGVALFAAWVYFKK